MQPNPVEILDEVVSLAKSRQRLASIFDRVRRADEIDEQTLNRLIVERQVIVNLIRTHEKGRLHFRDHDHEYKTNFAEVVKKYLQIKP